MSSAPADPGTNFIRARIERDNERGTYSGRVATRFPPEPNGWLHLGHAKSICLNFGLGHAYGGTTNLRFDDTNPTTEEVEFAQAILADVRWLGFEPTAVFHASDYFEQLYLWAEKLIVEGKAYVDDQTLEEMRATRGTVMEAGTPSPYRSRSVEENLSLFRQMRAGAFEDGAKVLRAKIDMANPNMKMRDPLMYRIRHAHHYRTGDTWCIYPMYDWAHCLSDAKERITHSICTLEFENNRELYDWFVEAVGFEQPPKQIEFARLNLTYTVLSKRKLLQLVEGGMVSGWDDPRMPTIAGFRARGVPARAIREFCHRIGVAKANSTVDVELMDYSIRDVLNTSAPRRMAVYEPIEVELTNWPTGKTLSLTMDDFPPDVEGEGQRDVTFGGRVFIEREDFQEVPERGFKRLSLGGEVRLRGAYVIKCHEVVKDADGQIAKLLCSVDLDTLGRNPEGRKVKGTIHWVDAETGIPCVINAYDRLFNVPQPGKDGSFLDDLNPNSLRVYNGICEAGAAVNAGAHLQFERKSYVMRAAGEGLAFNVVVGLKDSWKKSAAAAPAKTAEKAAAPDAATQQRLKLEALERTLSRDPALRERYESLLAQGLDSDHALTLSQVQGGAEFFAQVKTAVAAKAVGGWMVNTFLPALEEDAVLSELAVSPGQIGSLLGLIDKGVLSSKLGKKVLDEMLSSGGEPEQIARGKGWIQLSDESALAETVKAVLDANPAEYARLKAGDKKLLGFFVGQVMKATRGTANPKIVKNLLQGI